MSFGGFGLSSKFSEAVADLEKLIERASSLKKDPAPPLGPVADDDDHGNSISEATEAELPCSIVGVIDYVGDLDYFSVQAEAGIVYVIATAGDFFVTLQSSQGQHLTSGQPSFAYAATVSEVLYFLVQNRSGRTGPYTLSISAPTDDHGNSIFKATAVQVPSTTDGVIEYVGDLDHFSFQAEAGTAYVIATPGDFFAILQSSQWQHLTSGQPSFAYTSAVSEVLYVLVQNRSGRAGPYTLSISAPSDDHGNSISKATAVQVPSTTDGVIEYVGDLDYFFFQAEAGTTYVVATAGDFFVTLYNSQGQRLISGQPSFAYTASTSWCRTAPGGPAPIR